MELEKKDHIRMAMSGRRLELINSSAAWILRHEPFVLDQLANGRDIRPEQIDPLLEECTTEEQHGLFRYCRFMGSLPYSDYVGRRIRFLIRDNSLPNKPVMGIAAIGSSLIQVSARDKWIGWIDENGSGKKHRSIKKSRIGNIMDLFVAMAVPPYNELLVGKLICYMMVSNEVRDIFRRKYRGRKTVLLGKEIADMVLLSTTSVYGKNSSQYNRLTFVEGNPAKKRLLYIPVGETVGYGSFLTNQQKFEEMLRYLSGKGIHLSNRFGDGANWKMRVIRTYYDEKIRSDEAFKGKDSDDFLNHGFRRGVFVVPLADNCREFLRGETDDIEYCNYPLKTLIDYWKKRWLEMRVRNDDVMRKLRTARKNQIKVSKLLRSN